jgi:hypothetical protein
MGGTEGYALRFVFILLPKVHMMGIIVSLTLSLDKVSCPKRETLQKTEKTKSIEFKYFIVSSS